MSSSENISPANNAGKKIDVYADFDPEVKIRTKKMLMYFIIFAIVMLFAGLTSIVLVMNSKNYWVHAFPPSILWVSNLLVVLSSICFYSAVKAAKKDQKSRTMVLVLLAFIMGIGFTFTQSFGWKALSKIGMGVTVTEMEPGIRKWHWNSLDQMTGTYGVDYEVRKGSQTLVFQNDEFYLPGDTKMTQPVSNRVRETFNASGAMICTLIVLHIFHLVFGLVYLLVLSYRTTKNRVNSQNWISLHTGSMYWHFMGILWLYLFFFLFYIQ